MPLAGWSLNVVTAKTLIYTSLHEGELFKVIKAYDHRAET